MEENEEIKRGEHGRMKGQHLLLSFMPEHDGPVQTMGSSDDVQCHDEYVQ